MDGPPPGYTRNSPTGSFEFLNISRGFALSNPAGVSRSSGIEGTRNGFRRASAELSGDECVAKERLLHPSGRRGLGQLAEEEYVLRLLVTGQPPFDVRDDLLGCDARAFGAHHRGRHRFAPDRIGYCEDGRFADRRMVV